MKYQTTFLSLVSLCLASASFATVWTVDDDGKADFNNIQAAVDAAVDGDEIIVMPGTYTSTEVSVVIIRDKALWIHSSDGPEATVIDGGLKLHGIYISDLYSGVTDVVIEGFTVANAFDSNYGDGTGISSYQNNTTIRNCIFINNSTNGKGGAVFATSGNFPSYLTIEDCLFFDNSASKGGGLFVGNRCNAVITNCRFESNTADYGGGVFSALPDMLTVTDTIFCGNTVDQVYGFGEDELGNCIAFSCQDDDGDGLPDECTGEGNGVHHVPSEFPTIQDAIIAAGYGDEIIVAPGIYFGSGGTIASNGPQSVMNTGGKALWIHSSEGPDSTFIDGGGWKTGIQCSSGESTSTHIEGFTVRNCTAAYQASTTSSNYRYGGGIYCLLSSPSITNCRFVDSSAGKSGGGAYFDYSSSTMTNCSFSNNEAELSGGGVFSASSLLTFINCEIIDNSATSAGGIYLSESVVFTNCNIKNNSASSHGGGILSYTNIPLFTDTVVCSNTPDQIFGDWIDGGENCFAIACTDENQNGIPDECDGPGGVIHRVPEDFQNIQQAIDAASNGDEIVIAPGTYIGIGDSVFDTKGKSLWIHGSGSAEETIITGQWARLGIRCTSGETETTIIEGLTITLCNGKGGLYCVGASPTIRNCVFLINRPGVTYKGGSLIITGCSFIENFDNEGGGINLQDSNAVITDCTFENNSSNGTNSKGGGGIFSSNSTLDVINCLFHENTSDGRGGGVYCIAGSVTFQNCRFSGNVSDNGGGGVSVFFGNSELTNCVFEDNEAVYGGGAALIGSAELHDCIFTNNHGRDGGGLTSLYGQLILENCDLSNNSAQMSGGGVYCLDEPVEISHCTITLNTASTGGGGVYAKGGEVSILQSIICSNSPNQIDGEFIDLGGNTVTDECPPPCPDTNSDGFVDIGDVNLIISDWGESISPADINFDGIVDILDFLIVIDRWGPCE